MSLFFLQAMANVLAHLHSIPNHRLDTRGGFARTVALAGATLIPLDDGEVAFPAKVELLQPAAGRARAAMQHEDCGIIAILAADDDPLRRSSIP